MKQLNLLKERHFRLVLTGMVSKQHKMFLYIIDVLLLASEILGKERGHSHQTESPVSMTEPNALIDSQEDLLRTWSGGKIIFASWLYFDRSLMWIPVFQDSVSSTELACSPAVPVTAQYWSQCRGNSPSLEIATRETKWIYWQDNCQT